MELRKVIFVIVKADVGAFDLSKNEKGNEDFEERRGFFHIWGLTVNENSLQKTCAIIEEEETGKVFVIDPENVRFL